MAALHVASRTQLMPVVADAAVHVVLSVLGVLVAFPMKRRFINDEQQPFPEGRACGVVLDTLYSSRRTLSASSRPRSLAIAGAAARLRAAVCPARTS